MNLETIVSVDLEEVREFIESQKFLQFLLNNTTDFATAGFILQTLLDKLEELGESHEKYYNY